MFRYYYYYNYKIPKYQKATNSMFYKGRENTHSEQSMFIKLSIPNLSLLLSTDSHLNGKKKFSILS